jgi:hypothetical protein
MTNKLPSIHPQSGVPVTLNFDDNKQLLSANYDDGEDVMLSDRLTNEFQSDIDSFVVRA